MGSRPPKDETWNESPSGGQAPLVRPESYLFVALESERPLSGGSRHVLRGTDTVAIGRADERRSERRERELTLSLPSRWMSGAHARIRRVDAGFVLEDLGSKNGVLVNGLPVAHVVLADHDLVELGRTLLVFREALHAPPGVPADVDAREVEPPATGLSTLLPGLVEAAAALQRIARSTVPVLLRGETGTGKEVTARAVHAMSGRSGPFLGVNCGAIPSALLESQLFGHIKGAFSGAVKDEPGFVRAASGGTLFLDEIGDLPHASQAALLRVLEEGEVVPVGTTRPVPVDLRVVAATNQPLEALVAKGAFRGDLLARLDGYTHALPPLRERKEDIGLLTGALLSAATPDAPRVTLGADVARALFAHEWPGNARELKQCLARALALAGDAMAIEKSHLPPAVAGASPGRPAPEEPFEPTEDGRLRAQLEALLAEHEGNVAEVARAMGKARMQVHRWMKRFDLDPNRYRKV